ncbi:MAG: HPF/RaiA family ribosome-associated protein [Planctomycetota bacterium]
MRVDVRIRRIPNAQRAREWVARRLDFALGRFAPQIDQVHVTLEDTNGPRGGVDKRCKVRVLMNGKRAPIFAEDHDADLAVAIDRAAQRVSHSVGRAINRAGRPPRGRPAAEESWPAWSLA